MCGLNGIYAYGTAACAPNRAELLATRDHMSARGPDGAGEWWSADRRVGLGHRRLSIIDLSDRANQPMASGDGRYMVVFNGEIYNFPQLRDELQAEGAVFRTTSDTEVLLELYIREGQDMLGRLRGMFAFAIWDDADKRVFLARDPYGIKPLYYSDKAGIFRFASQAKALLAGRAVPREPDPAGVAGFYLWGSVPEPFTIYRSIRQVPAGSSMIVDARGVQTPREYFSIAETYRSVEAAAIGETKAVSDAMLTRSALLDSVRHHLVADVPV